LRRSVKGLKIEWMEFDVGIIMSKVGGRKKWFFLLNFMVGRCRLPVSKPKLKARLVSALDETKM
jgi:hypothetical protein